MPESAAWVRFVTLSECGTADFQASDVVSGTSSFRQGRQEGMPSSNGMGDIGETACQTDVNGRAGPGRRHECRRGTPPGGVRHKGHTNEATNGRWRRVCG